MGMRDLFYTVRGLVVSLTHPTEKKSELCPCWEEQGDDGMCKLPRVPLRTGGRDSPCVAYTNCPSLTLLAQIPVGGSEETSLFNPDYVSQVRKFC